MRILVDGSLDPAIDGDPRITESQGQAMLKVARSDPNAEVVGIDSRLRPVVRARLGGAKAASDFGLYRGGGPAPVELPVIEEWD